MTTVQQIQFEGTLSRLYLDSKNDYVNIMKGAEKSVFGPMKPIDFKDAYLAITKEQVV